MRTQRPWSASVFESGICHYCGDRAGTVDHIVPRDILPKPMSQVPYWFRSHNEVPCCSPCNNKKGHYYSDCTCDICTWAWRVAIACFTTKAPPTRVVKIVRSPG